MGRIIAIANQKGGVGKTTTAINLAACLAEAGQKILIIDIDPQGNTTSGFGLSKTDIEKTVYEVLLGECNIKDAIVENIIDNLDILPSNVNLAGAEIDLIDVDNREYIFCLLYTSDAADEEDSVDLGGCRILKKKKNEGE